VCTRGVITQGTVWVYKSNRCLFLERKSIGKGKGVHNIAKVTIDRGHKAAEEIFCFTTMTGEPLSKDILAKVYWNKARTSLRMKGTSYKFSSGVALAEKLFLNRPLEIPLYWYTILRFPYTDNPTIYPSLTVSNFHNVIIDNDETFCTYWIFLTLRKRCLKIYLS